MTFTWGRSAISYVTAVSLTAALVVGVFSQSHAAITSEVQASEAEPCPGHMTAPAVVVEDNCLTMCDAADLEHFVGVLSERQDTLEYPAALVTYAAVVPRLHESRHASSLVAVRGPPDKPIYLLTQRFRL